MRSVDYDECVKQWDIDEHGGLLYLTVTAVYEKEGIPIMADTCVVCIKNGTIAINQGNTLPTIPIVAMNALIEMYEDTDEAD